MADGTIKIDTKIDDSGIKEGSRNIRAEAAKLAAEYKKTGLSSSDAFKKAWSEIERETKKGVDGSKKELSALTVAYGNLVSQGILKAVSALTNFAKKGLEVASNLQEVQNVVDTTFGKSAEAINKFAKDATASIGLTELQAKQFSSTMGAMLKSVGLTDTKVLDMSVNMTKLAGDMASFYNLDHEEAFNKLRSGISGEIEPLKQLGINLSVANLEAFALSQGIRKSYENMSEAEKTTLRYNYILKATADAQGDFSKTSGSYANQIRILKGELETTAGILGASLLPKLTKLATEFTTFLKDNEQRVTNFGNIIANVVGVVSKLIEILLKIPAPVYAIVGSIILGIKVFTTMNNTMSALTGGLSKTADGVDKAFDIAKWGQIAAIVIGVTAAVTMLAVALSVLFGKSDQMSQAVNNISSGVNNLGKGVNNAMNSVSKPGKGYATGTDNASRGWHWVGEKGPELMYFNGGETVLNNRNAMAVARGGLTAYNSGVSTSTISTINNYNMSLFGTDFVTAMKQAQQLSRRRS